jgi:hypothetical protein
MRCPTTATPRSFSTIRPDRRQVVIALVVTAEGFPMAHEVLDCNTSDKAMLAPFQETIQSMCGRARRVWVMDRGIPSEATLATMRAEGEGYLVGTPKSTLNKLERQLVGLAWEQVHSGMKVRLLERDGELFVQASSRDRQLKETAIRRRKLKRLVHGLDRLKGNPPGRHALLRRVAVLQKEAGRVRAFVTTTEPKPTEPVNRSTFRCAFDRRGWNASLDRDGSYVLRARPFPGPTSPKGWTSGPPYCGSGTCNWSASRRRSGRSSPTWTCGRSTTSSSTGLRPTSSSRSSATA